MTDRIRWGVLSTAGIGRKRVIPAIGKSSNGVVAAVASRGLEKAQSFAAELGIPTAYGSYEELIAADDIDAIYIPVPNSEHAEWSIRCAEAGKPTLCEKPLASDAPEAQKMVDAFAERGVLFAEAFMYRFHPQTQKVKELLDAGAVGEIHTLRAAFTFAVNSEDDIRLSAELAGGSLRDVGAYCVNVMRFMTGHEPEGVKALAKFGAKSGVDETFSGVLKFPGDVLGHFDCGLRTFREHSYELRGDEGRILIEEGFVMDPEHSTFIRHWKGDDYQEIEISPADHYTLMAEDFADALLNDRPPRFAPMDGVANMDVLDRLAASAREVK